MTVHAGPVAPVVAGYRVEELIGFGGCGEVWRARDVLSGRLVALKTVRHDGPPEQRDRLRREAAVLAGLTSAHIVRLVTVVTSARGLVLVLDFQAGGSLASLLQTRPTLPPGEVVTIAGPLAAALAEVHAAGWVHGDLSPANVLFAGDGRPMLSDLGVARLAGRAGASALTACYADPLLLDGAPLTPTVDVYGLAAVCFEALTGRPPFPGEDADAVRAAAVLPRPRLHELAPLVPRRLADLVEAALAEDPVQRPDAAAFAAGLLDACPAQPVRLAGATVPVAATPTSAVRRLPVVVEPPPPTPSRAERLAAALGRVRLSPRRVLTLAAVPVAVTGAVWGGVAWAHSGSAGPGPAAWAPAAAPVTPASLPTVNIPTAAVPAAPSVVPPASPVPATAPATPTTATVTAATMQAALARLDARRADAFTAGDRSLLDQVYVAGSAPLAADRRRLDGLLSAGEHVAGLSLRIRSVEVVSASASGVGLRVADELAPYALVRSDGSVAQRLPARALTTWSIRLVPAGTGGWRIASIAAT